MMTFLSDPEPTPAAQELFDEDMGDLGYVMNASKLWAHHPAAMADLFALLGSTVPIHGLDVRQRGILVTACASTLGDSYCSLAWGAKLASASDARTAAGVLSGDDSDLTDGERALAAWARQVSRDPNGTTAADVQSLRDAGYTDTQIFAITLFVALRIAFSTVNDALGAHPDAALRSTVPAAVLAAVTYGRPVERLQGESGDRG
jgi:alkylhydroperoxidase family enzyme